MAAPAASRPPARDPLPGASFPRRIAAMVYEVIVVAAVLFIASLAFHGAATERIAGATRLVFQVYLVTVLGLYFVWFWRRGQTLPMKAWKLRLVQRAGGPVTAAQAALRYAAAALVFGASFAAALYLREHPQSLTAWLALVPGPISLAWVLADPDRQALYDRIAGTRLVREGDG